MLVGFLALHAIGARYIYSYVPYDQWSQHLCGVTISSVFGWERNHYDRLVHFSFGLLLAHPTREIFERNELARGIWSRYFALEFIIAASAVYELAEWFVAILFAPDWADRYLGQQGDMWDAQKDMALASCGAIIALAHHTSVGHSTCRNSFELRSTRQYADQRVCSDSFAPSDCE